LDVGDEEGGDDVGEWDEVGGGDDDHDDGGGVGGGGVREVEDVDAGVEEENAEDEEVDSGGSEDTDLFVVTDGSI
jgi:hypothetical protein